MKRLWVCLIIISSIMFPNLCWAMTSTEIAQKDTNLIKSAIASDMFDMGYTIHSTNEYQIIFKKDRNDFASTFLFGSNFNRTPELRASFSIVQNDKTVKIVLDAKTVTNPGSGFEQYTPNYHPFWSYYLEELKARFDGGAYFGFDISSEKKDGGNIVIRVIKSSSAEEAGLQKGDIITLVDGKKTDEKKLIKLFSSAPEGTTLALTVKRAGEKERQVAVTKKYVHPSTSAKTVEKPATNPDSPLPSVPIASPAPNQ